MTTPGVPGHGLADGAGIAAEELRTARFVLALVAQGIAGDEGGLRWVAMAMRGQIFRQHIDAHHAPHRASCEELSLKALPPEWHEAWQWGFRWEPPSDEPAGPVPPALARLRAEGWPRR